MTTLIRPRSPDWHSVRRDSVTSTDIPVILGLSPYRSEGSLARQKLGTPDPEEPDAKRERRMRLGLLLEDAIRSEDELEHGIRLVRVNKVLTHRSIPWARTSLDFRRVGEKTIVEAKSSRSYRWDEGLPQDVEAQVRWQMGVAGYPRAHVVALRSGSDLQCFDLEHDEDTFAGLVDIAADFRRRLAEGGPFSENLASLKAHYPSDDGSTIEADEATAIWVQSYLASKRLIADAEEARDKAQAAIEQAMATATRLEGPGWHATWKRTKDITEIDYRAIATELAERLSGEERSEVYDRWTTAKPGARPFRVWIDREADE